MSKETYVKEMPKSCYICHCFDTSEAMCSITGTYTKFKQGRILEDCPLIDIKTHNRELVKEVCERIKNWGNKHFNWVGDGTGYDGQDYNEMIGFNNAIRQLNEFLDQIQKDIENG